MSFEEYKIVILGTQCFLSGMLNGYKMRCESLPFDWTMTTSLSGITKILRHKFNDYLNPQYLSNDSDYFDMSHFGAGHNIANLMISSNIYEDLYTRHHDIIDNETERLTIERRINRLLHILSNSDGKEIIFMRYLNDGYLTRKLQDNCVNNLTLSEDNLSTTLSSITDFLDMLSTTYPNVKKFKLLLFTSSRLLYEQVNNETIANCKISLVPEVSIPSKTVLQNLIRDNN